MLSGPERQERDQTRSTYHNHRSRNATAWNRHLNGVVRYRSSPYRQLDSSKAVY